MKLIVQKMLLGLSVLVMVSSAYAVMGFSKGEMTSGMNKICYYDVLGSTKAINVNSYELCPINHDF